MDEKEIFQKLMKKQVEPGALRDQLRALRVRTTYGNAILFQMVKRAAEGDLSAAKYILGAVQEEETVQKQAGVADLSELSTEELRRMLNAEC